MSHARPHALARSRHALLAFLLLGCANEPTSPGGPDRADDTAMTDTDGDVANDDENVDCIDALIDCRDAGADPLVCVQPYVVCRGTQGVSECSAVYEACQHLGTEAACAAAWPHCYDSGESDGGEDADGGESGAGESGAGESGAGESGAGDADGGSGGGATCLTQAQCELACANRVWICTNCSIDWLCPHELDLEACLWECDVAFDTDNDIVLALDSCTLELCQTCDDDALTDCFFSTHC